jgi:hypothetical protein
MSVKLNIIGALVDDEDVVLPEQENNITEKFHRFISVDNKHSIAREELGDAFGVVYLNRFEFYTDKATKEVMGYIVFCLPVSHEMKDGTILNMQELTQTFHEFKSKSVIPPNVMERVMEARRHRVYIKRYMKK